VPNSSFSARISLLGDDAVQVLEKKDLLLTNLDRAAELEDSLAPVFAGASALKASTDKLRSELLVPYAQLKEKALHLENIQGAAELLRRVLRHLFLTKKLKTQLSGGVRELSKAAQTVYELQECHAGGGLEGVRVVESEMAWIKDTTGMIIGQAERLLLHGVETLNQADIGSALQVFFNLHLLGEKVTVAMQSVMQTAATALKTALDVTTFPEDKRGGGPGNISRGGHGGIPGAGSSATWRSTLWQRMAALLDTLQACCIQVVNLHRVLAKKRDPQSYTLFVDTLAAEWGDDEPVSARFWRELLGWLGGELLASTQQNSFIKATMDSEYPKLLALVQDLVKKQAQNADPKLGIYTVQSPADAAHAWQALAPFEAGCMKRTVSRMFEPVNQVNLTPPFSVKPTEVQGIAATISAELRAVREQPDFAKRVLRQGVSKALQLFATKCAAAVTAGDEALQTVDVATAAQLQNASIHNGLLLLRDESVKVLQQQIGELSTHSAPEEQEAYECAKALGARAEGILSPLVLACQDELDTIVAEMHHENFDKALPQPSNLEASHGHGVTCSPYIRRLEGSIAHCRRRILAKFSGFTVEDAVKLGCQVVGSFVRNASFVSLAQTEAGKMRLATDMAQLELALAPLCSTAELGQAVEYGALRHLRPMLFLSQEEVVADRSSTMPPSAVVHHLLSRVPEIPLPHTFLEWTAAEYALWLREHNEKEIWTSAVEPCLARYKAQTELQNTEPNPMHAVVLALAPQLLTLWGRAQLALQKKASRAAAKGE